MNTAALSHQGPDAQCLAQLLEAAREWLVVSFGAADIGSRSLAECVEHMGARPNARPGGDTRLFSSSLDLRALIRILDYVRAEIRAGCYDSGCVRALERCIDRLTEVHRGGTATVTAIN